MAPNNTIIVGISGASASGKSLLSNTIVNELDSKRVIVISEDSYYKDLSHLPIEERAKFNFDHPNSLDHELLTQQLAEIKEGKTVYIPTYDFSQHSRAEKTRKISGGDHAIIVLEGILLFSNQTLRESMDIRIFMDTPLDICLIRRLKRDIEERGRTITNILDQYMQTVRPMYFQFIEPSKRYADIIVPRGGQNRIAIDMIKAKMRELL